MSAPTTMPEALQWALRRLESANMHGGEHFDAADRILAAAKTERADDEITGARHQIGKRAVLEAQWICDSALRVLHTHEAELLPELEPLRGQLQRLHLLAGLSYAAISGDLEDATLDEMHRDFHGFPRTTSSEVRP